MKVKTLVVMAVSSLLAISFACATAATLSGRLVDDMTPNQSPSNDATANPGAMDNNATANPGASTPDTNLSGGPTDSNAVNPAPSSGSSDEDTQDTATGDSEGDY